MEILLLLKDILLQLGANETAFIQFFIFVISITFLTIFVYGPFFKAYDERQKQTKGADQVAIETQEEAKRIESIFQMRAREINGKINAIFETSKKQAQDSSAIIINEAKTLATNMTDTARKEIDIQKQNAEKNILNVSQEVSSEISKKLTGVF